MLTVFVEGAAALDGGGFADVEAVAGFWVVLIGVGEVFVVFKKRTRSCIEFIMQLVVIIDVIMLGGRRRCLPSGVAGVYLFLRGLVVMRRSQRDWIAETASS